MADSSTPPAASTDQRPEPAASTEQRLSAPSASDVDAGAAGIGGHRLSVDGRSATFSSHVSVGISNATLWRNKAVSCESVRSFEASRKAQIDVFQDKDRQYWQAFEKEILRGREENTRLQRFFAMRIQADLAYAESLRKIRQVLERPVGSLASGPGASSSAPASGNGAASNGGPGGLDQFSVASSCMKALNTLGEVQQQLSEKFVQFSNVVRRDVVSRPLDDMVATFEERTTAMLSDGNRYDAMLHDAQRNVVESFSKYDAIYREMEADRHTTENGESSKKDLWLAEIAYAINVHKLKQCRVEYVKGMSALFQQYKNLELVRVSVIQTAVDTYARKQKLMYDELGGAMSEPLAAVQKIEPERDLMNSIRRIPKNYTAAALSVENSTDKKLFDTLRSPISSPLLVRCGFLKHQVTGSLFKSWKDVMCAITQDQFLHLIELKETANRSIVQSTEAMLEAILTNDQTTDVLSTSICLTNCRINMIGKSAVPTFEVIESSASTGLFSSVFRMETSRKFSFQCASQSDLIDWIVAAKRFIPPGASSITATAQ